MDENSHQFYFGQCMHFLAPSVAEFLYMHARNEHDRKTRLKLLFVGCRVCFFEKCLGILGDFNGEYCN